jgi:hypothetical protein
MASYDNVNSPAWYIQRAFQDLGPTEVQGLLSNGPIASLLGTRFGQPPQAPYDQPPMPPALMQQEDLRQQRLNDPLPAPRDQQFGPPIPPALMQQFRQQAEPEGPPMPPALMPSAPALPPGIDVPPLRAPALAQDAPQQGAPTQTAAPAAPSKDDAPVGGLDALGKLAGSLGGVGSSLMAIYNPEGAKAMVGQQKLENDKATGHYQFHVDPTNGVLLRYDTRTGKHAVIPYGTANNEQRKAYDTAVGKQFADLNGKIAENATSAQSRMGQLNQLQTLLSDPNVYQGSGGELTQSIKKMGQALGIDVQGTSNGEAAQSLYKQMALELRNPASGAGMPGALSDQDRKFLEQMAPSLNNTHEGNVKIIDAARKVAQRQVEMEVLRQNYISEHGRLDEGFYKAVKQHAEANPLFNGGLRKGIRSIEIVN